MDQHCRSEPSPAKFKPSKTERGPGDAGPLFVPSGCSLDVYSTEHGVTVRPVARREGCVLRVTELASGP